MPRAAVDLTEEWLNVLSQIFMGYEYLENEKLFVFRCFSYILSTLKSIYGRDVTFRVTVEFLRFFRIKYRFRQSVRQSISVALYDVLVKEPNIANIWGKNDKIADLILTFNENGQLYKQLFYGIASFQLMTSTHSSTFNIMRTTFFCKNAFLKNWNWS